MQRKLARGPIAANYHGVFGFPAQRGKRRNRQI